MNKLSKKKISLLAATGILTLGLAACNADDNAGMDPNTPTGTYGTSNYEPGIYGTNGNQNGTKDNNNGVNTRDGDGIDHNGPLTEDYNKEQGDFDFGTRRGNNNGDNGSGNGIDNYRTNSNGNVNADKDMNISSFSTKRSSKNYPHTRAIIVREAKYQYVPMKRERGQETENQQQAAPEQGQQNQQQATPEEGQQQQAQPKQEQQGKAGISQEAQQVIDLTNEQRKQNGLAPLQADTQLSGVAQKKSVDMAQNGYFSHTSPTYGSPFDMMRDSGVSYNTAGENIAQGQRTPKEVVDAWMDSPGHRKNILNPDFTHIGVGHAVTGHHWTQMFIGK
jgi:uncharacterized YkwD family protein